VLLLLPQISISVFTPRFLFSQPNTSSSSYRYLHKPSNSVGRATQSFNVCPMITPRIQLHFSSSPPPRPLRVKIVNNLDEMYQRSTCQPLLCIQLPASTFLFVSIWSGKICSPLATSLTVTFYKYEIDCRWPLSSSVSVIFMAWSRLFLGTFWYLSVCSYELKCSRQIHYEVCVCSILCCKFLRS